MEGVREALRNLISSLNSELEGEGIELVGVMLAPTGKGYNFSLFDVTENEFVLSLQIGKYIVYLAFESEDEIEEDEYSDIIEELLHMTVPSVRELIRKASEGGINEPLILFDKMSQDLKEFLYGLLLKHRKGELPYEQTELA
jgi:hypothetical protein